MLDESYTALIRTWDNSGVEYVGTGYPIKPNMLLTARHVIAPENQDVSKGISIEWTLLKHQELLTFDKLSEVVLYDGYNDKNNYDIALLQCTTPLNPDNYPQLLQRFPLVGSSYECRGFPLAGKDDEGHDTIPVPGSIEGGTTSAQLELIAKTDMAVEDDWAGLSGSPIFVDDRLAGVVNIKYSTVKKLLYAVSIPYLLQEGEDFQRVLEIQESEIIKIRTLKLHKKLTLQIVEILNRKNIPLNKLVDVLQLDAAATSSTVANYLVEKLTVIQATSRLLKVSIQQQKKQQGSEQWEGYLYDIEQLCGWLLINSIEPEWWFQHEQHLQKQVDKRMTTSFPLETSSFIEVVISRGLLQQAQYRINEYGDLIPVSENHDVMLFDCTSDDASDLQLLSDIYKDLRPGAHAPQDKTRLLEGIFRTARSLFQARDKKPIYYIVSKEYIELLQSTDWFKEAEQKMAGFFQFVCCEETVNQQQNSPCSEDQDFLLENVASILRLRNKERASHV